MAKRMFSDEITTADAFLDMPSESQLLYFHLGMQADDDGFISNIKMVQRVIGASDDSAKILFAKKFLIHFESGVSVIKHWRINNKIRKDIYRETKYTKEKEQLFIRKNGSYTLNPDGALKLPSGHYTVKEAYKNKDETTAVTVRRRDVDVGKVRIGKDRIDKNSIELPDWLDKEAWNEWIQYKKEKRKVLTPQMIKLQFKKLEADKEHQREIIEQSIANGWTGLFEYKGSTVNKKKAIEI